MVAAACGSDGVADTVAETADNVADEVEDAVTDDDGDEAMEDDEDGVMEDDEEEDPAEEAPADEDVTLTVAIVGNPQLEDIQELTPEFFTGPTGINVEFVVLDEGTLREVTTRDVAAGGDQFDVVQIGMFETPQFGAAGFIQSLQGFAEADDSYDIDDILPAVRGGLSVDGELFSAPFYAESSFIMYRADVLEEAGQTMPNAPTWDEVAAIARAIDTDERAGICLRGLAGWGDLGASFTTVLNTFGGTWWLDGGDTIGEAQFDQPEAAEAFNFYVDLLNDAGQDDAANSSFNQCLALYQNDEVAMWYDATVAASILEAPDSPVVGLNDYALAPQGPAGIPSGWLWSWTLAIPSSNTDLVDEAWEFISWATGPDYLTLVGEEIAWVEAPPGTRTSLYENPNYTEAAAAFADITLEAMNAAQVDNPGVDPRPGLPGVQFVGVPQFQDAGNQCTAQLGSAIGGGQSVDDALSACQAILEGFTGQTFEASAS